MNTVLARLVLLVSLAAAGPAAAQQSTDSARQSLQDLADVEVVVEALIEDAAIDGLTDDGLRRAVEARLRQAGFALTPTAAAYLYVNVNMTFGSGIYIYCAELQLRQATRLERDAHVLVPEAVTWQTGIVGAIPELELDAGVTSIVLEQVNEFLGAYEAVNPGALAARRQAQ